MFRHNERRNRNYSNNNIDKEKSYLNYSLKEPQYSYENKKGRIKYVNKFKFYKMQEMWYY